ncbi:MAG: hypothetical protein DWQ02_00245 [Bacteroidetes bacterium]|nr:MAG: hypothetical protein DWQ02_00245 [Bacteroidota bacterium]
MNLEGILWVWEVFQLLPIVRPIPKKLESFLTQTNEKQMKTILSFTTIFFLTFFGTVHAQSPKWQHYRLIREAEKAYDNLDYQTSLKKYEEAFKIKNNSRLHLYNAACSASLAGEYEKAYQFLVQGIDLWFLDIDWMKNDNDFTGFKETHYWEKVLNRINNKYEEIQQDFSQIKKTKLTELVPFKKNGRWGYLDRKTKKILVQAKYYGLSFGGKCLMVELAEKHFVILQNDGTVELYNHRPKPINIPPPPKPYSNKREHHPVIDTTEGFLGFRANYRGEITHVSSVYDSTETFRIDGQGEPYVLIFGPYLINDQWYARVRKNENWGLINEAGETLENFSFKFFKLYELEGDYGDDHWFIFSDSTWRYGIMNLNGEVKLYGEFDNLGRKYENLGLLIVQRNGSYGIIDLKTLEWKLKPFPETLLKIKFSHTEFCDSENKVGRDQVKRFYFLVRNSAGKEYYIDEFGERYISN